MISCNARNCLGKTIAHTIFVACLTTDMYSLLILGARLSSNCFSLNSSVLFWKSKKHTGVTASHSANFLPSFNHSANFGESSYFSAHYSLYSLELRFWILFGWLYRFLLHKVSLGTCCAWILDAMSCSFLGVVLPWDFFLNLVSRSLKFLSSRIHNESKKWK